MKVIICENYDAVSQKAYEVGGIEGEAYLMVGVAVQDSFFLYCN